MPRKKNVILVSTIGFGAFLVCSVFLVFAFGLVTGSEFSPETFQRRQFKYYEIPVLRIQISPVTRVPQSDTTANYLQSKNLLPVQTPVQWHLDWLARRTRIAYGDARLLCQYLDIPGRAAPLWQGWSVDNPDAAEILWPRVQELARAELYVLLPDVFEIAQAAGDAEDLRTGLDEYIAMRLEFLAKHQKSLGKPGHALELANLALKLIPQDHPRSAALRRIQSENRPDAEAAPGS